MERLDDRKEERAGKERRTFGDRLQSLQMTEDTILQPFGEFTVTRACSARALALLKQRCCVQFVGDFDVMMNALLGAGV